MASDLALPYYPQYVRDFRESKRVLAMNLEQEGLYRRCLDLAWEHGSIPDDPKEIARLIQKDPREVKRAWAVVRSCWASNGELGRLVNAREEIERKKAQERHSKASKAAAQKAAQHSAREPAQNGAQDAAPQPATRASGNLSSLEVCNSLVLSKDVNDESDLLFQEFMGVFLAAGVAMNQRDIENCQWKFLPLDLETKRFIVADVKAKATNGTWPSADKTKRPWNYLDGNEWTRKAIPRALPSGHKSASQEAHERAAKRFMEEQ